MSTPAVTDAILGMEVEDAKRHLAPHGLHLRVTRRDDEHYRIKLDNRLDRVNVEVDSNVVVKTSIG